MIQLLWKLYLKLTNPSCSIKAAALSRNVKMEKGVSIGSGSVVCADLIGKYTFINKYCLIDKSTKSIGRFCSIAYGAKVGLGEHPKDWISTHPFAYNSKYGFVNSDKVFTEKKNNETIIGNDVWVGANAIILSGVKVGDGAIIGANSLVTSDVEEYSLVVGSPAKHLKYRFEEEKRTALILLKWWDWDDSKIKKEIDGFDRNFGVLK